MDQWIFTPEELYQFPSITYGGMSLEEEWLRRLTGCILIQAIGARLEVPLPTLATAMTFFHRFFTQHSFVHYRLEVVAACCLYFACKVEESFRNINDVVGSTMLNILGPNNHSEDHAKLFHSLREGILQYEMILVETLCFDIALNHPYTPLIDMLAQTEADESVAHSALAFLNDSMRLPLCLLYDPKLIAAACICLAYRDQRQELPTNAHSFAHFIDSHSANLSGIITEIMKGYKLIERLERRNAATTSTSTNQAHQKQPRHTSTNNNTAPRRPSTSGIPPSRPPVLTARDHR